MTAWLIYVVFAALAAFGVAMYRFGRKTAENENLKAGARENETVDKIIRLNADIGRDELLDRLHDYTHK